MSTTVKDEVMTALACLQRSQNGYRSKNMEVDGLLTAYPSHDCEVGLAEVRGKRRLPVFRVWRRFVFQEPVAMFTLSQFKCEAQASSSILYVVYDEACKMTKKCMMPTVHSIAALQGFSCRTCVSAPVHHQSLGPVLRSASAAVFF